MKHIRSRDNPRYRHFAALATDGRYRREQGRTLADGIHLSQAVFDASRPVRCLIVAESAGSHREIAPMLVEAADRELETVLLSDAMFKNISTVDATSGVMVEVDICVPAGRRTARSDVLVLAGVQDAGNLGTLLRTAVAAGIAEAWLSEGCSHAWAPKVLRAGMGAHFGAIAIHERVDIPVAFSAYQGQILVTDLSAQAVDLFDADLRTPSAWLFGAEGKGVPPALMGLAHQRLRIPMPGAAESLNVAAAAAVCLFEQVRQRRGAGG